MVAYQSLLDLALEAFISLVKQYYTHKAWSFLRKASQSQGWDGENQNSHAQLSEEGELPDFILRQGLYSLPMSDNRADSSRLPCQKSTSLSVSFRQSLSSEECPCTTDLELLTLLTPLQEGFILCEAIEVIIRALYTPQTTKLTPSFPEMFCLKLLPTTP